MRPVGRLVRRQAGFDRPVAPLLLAGGAELLDQHLHHRQRLRTGNVVVDALAFTAGMDKALLPQHPQLLGQGGLRNTDQGLQLPHVFFALAELAQQHEAIGIGEHLHEAAGLLCGAAEAVGIDGARGRHGGTLCRWTLVRTFY